MEDRTQQAYRAALLAEMEEEITRRTLSRVQVITRSMAPAEKEAYLVGKAFQNAGKRTGCISRSRAGTCRRIIRRNMSG